MKTVADGTFGIEDVKEFILTNRWKEAKSMPKIPHSYCLKKSCSDPRKFEQFVLYIREHGIPRRFFRRVFVYLDVGIYEYWTMGNPLSETTLINRAVRRGKG